MPLSVEINGQFCYVVENSDEKNIIDGHSHVKVIGRKAGGDIYLSDGRLIHLPNFSTEAPTLNTQAAVNLPHNRVIIKMVVEI